MAEAEALIEKTMRDHCGICEKPEEIIYRLDRSEEYIKDLYGRTSTTRKALWDKIEELKTETASKMEANQKETSEKFDKFNTYLTVNLTAVVISLILLIANLIVTYGGK